MCGDLGNGLAVFGTTVLPLEKNTLEGDPVAGCGDADGRCVVMCGSEVEMPRKWSAVRTVMPSMLNLPLLTSRFSGGGCHSNHFGRVIHPFNCDHIAHKKPR